MRDQTERNIRLSRAALLLVLSSTAVACGGSSSETPYPLEPKQEELHPKEPEVTSEPPPRASDQGAPLTPTPDASAPSAGEAPSEAQPEPATTLD